MLEEVVEKTLGLVAPWCKDFLDGRLKKINAWRQRRKQERRSARKRPLLAAAHIADANLTSGEIVSGTFTLRGDDSLARLKLHIDEISSWSSRIRFRDMSHERALNDIYIDLDTFLIPVSLHQSHRERRKLTPLRKAISETTKHCVVLGQPGAGKTTSMQKICSSFFENSSDSRYRFPLLVRFRAIDYAETEFPIRKYLKNYLIYDLELTNAFIKLDPDSASGVAEDVFCAILNEMEVLLVLDGFDEIPTRTAKSAALKEIRALCANLRKSKVLVTCRAGEFNYTIPECQPFEIAPLTPDQVATLARRWLRKEDDLQAFLDAVWSSPFADVSIKPLTLAHLCAIYERTGGIPEKPKSVYKKIIWLYLSEWDEQRSVVRQSQYGKFDTDRKFEFLCSLSYSLTVDSEVIEFDEPILESAYLAICNGFGLPKEECTNVIRELESHTGLFIECGYRRYSFAHKSLQEYLTAEYLVRSRTLWRVEKIDMLGAEFAIATALSSTAGSYIAELFLGMYIGERVSGPFLDAYLSRLQIEKPDFLPSPEFTLSILAIISLAFNPALRIDANMRAPYLRSLIALGDVRAISCYYVIDGSESSPSEDLRLLRVKHHEAYQLRRTLLIPSSFGLSASMFESSATGAEPLKSREV